jgi:hypothetical protein
MFRYTLVRKEEGMVFVIGEHSDTLQNRNSRKTGSDSERPILSIYYYGIIAACLVLLLLAPVAAIPWTTETVDSGGEVGGYTSVALDSSGNPRISYYDLTSMDLNYAAGGVADKIGYRDDASAVWRLDYNGNRMWDGGVTDRVYVSGAAANIPVTGDWGYPF